MNQVLKLKISLNDIEPEIWRRIYIPSEITLHTLHQIIQDAMGWRDCHLYSFTINNIRYEMPPEDLLEDEEEPSDSETTMLSSLKLKKKIEFQYIYDFGDHWGHTIIVEDIIPYKETHNVPVCEEGARNCPPEDCGSIPGYYNLCKIIIKPKSEEAKEMFDWLGSEYDPEYFNLYATNTAIFKGFYRNREDE